MREQLLHLAQRAGRRHVTLLVLPLDSGTYGEYAGDRGSMNLVETPAQEHLVHLEPQDGSMLISAPAEVSTAGGEVAPCPHAVHVRDSKVTDGPGFSVAPEAWSAFLGRAG